MIHCFWSRTSLLHRALFKNMPKQLQIKFSPTSCYWKVIFFTELTVCPSINWHFEMIHCFWSWTSLLHRTNNYKLNFLQIEKFFYNNWKISMDRSLSVTSKISPISENWETKKFTCFNMNRSRTIYNLNPEIFVLFRSIEVSLHNRYNRKNFDWRSQWMIQHFDWLLSHLVHSVTLHSTFLNTCVQFTSNTFYQPRNGIAGNSFTCK